MKKTVKVKNNSPYNIVFEFENSEQKVAPKGEVELITDNDSISFFVNIANKNSIKSFLNIPFLPLYYNFYVISNYVCRLNSGNNEIILDYSKAQDNKYGVYHYLTANGNGIELPFVNNYVIDSEATLSQIKKNVKFTTLATVLGFFLYYLEILLIEALPVWIAVFLTYKKYGAEPALKVLAFFVILALVLGTILNLFKIIKKVLFGRKAKRKMIEYKNCQSYFDCDYIQSVLIYGDK